MPLNPDNLDIRAAAEDFFAPDRSEEIAFWARLAGQYGRNVLVPMCGTGEVACGLAQDGLIVTGIDDAAASIAAAEARRDSLGADVTERLHLREVASLDGLKFEGEFDFALLENGSLGRIPSKRRQEGTLRWIHRALRLGGGLGMELVAVSGAELEGRTQGPLRVGPRRSPPDGIKLEKMSQRTYDPAKRRMTVQETVTAEGEGPARRFDFESKVHVFELDDAASLLRGSGFEELSAYCDYSGTPYRRGCFKLIVVAEKPLYTGAAQRGRRGKQRSP